LGIPGLSQKISRGGGNSPTFLKELASMWYSRMEWFTIISSSKKAEVVEHDDLVTLLAPGYE
jgi:hypothetical protein